MENWRCVNGWKFSLFQHLRHVHMNVTAIRLRYVSSLSLMRSSQTRLWSPDWCPRPLSSCCGTRGWCWPRWCPRGWPWPPCHRDTAANTRAVGGAASSWCRRPEPATRRDPHCQCAHGPRGRGSLKHVTDVNQEASRTWIHQPMNIQGFFGGVESGWRKVGLSYSSRSFSAIYKKALSWQIF